MIIVAIIVIFCFLYLWFHSTDYDNCYNDMEDRGIAIFGSCGGVVGGDSNTEYLSEMCVSCPYYVSVPKTNDDNA